MTKLVGQEASGKISGAIPDNFSPETRAQMNLPKKVIINDCTLREGRQTEGGVLRMDEYIAIARQLVDVLNVPMIQTGCWSTTDYEYVEQLSKLGLNAKIEVMISGSKVGSKRLLGHNKEGIRELIGRIAGLSGSGLGIILNMACANEVLISRSIGRGETDLSLDYLKKREIELSVEAVLYGKSQKLSPVNINFQSFIKADPEYLETYCRELENAGVDMIALDDFAGGFAIPRLYTQRFQLARKAAPKTTFAIHAHNNIGQATACAMAALEGGCEVIDVGVNAYGEAAGHVDLAEAVTILEFLYGYDTGLNREKLYETCRFVADIMRHPTRKTAPIVGEYAFGFSHDSHWQFPKFPYLFNPFDAKEVGNEPRPYFGEWAGVEGLNIKAAKLGIDLSPEAAALMVEDIRAQMKWSKRTPTDDEFREMAARAQAKTK
jgi:isopropylmalate/homocitrate/citramalate synthase